MLPCCILKAAVEHNLLHNRKLIFSLRKNPIAKQKDLIQSNIDSDFVFANGGKKQKLLEARTKLPGWGCQLNTHITWFPKSNSLSYPVQDINRCISRLWWDCLFDYFQYLSIVDILYTFFLQNPLACCVIREKYSVCILKYHNIKIDIIVAME